MVDEASKNEFNNIFNDAKNICICRLSKEIKDSIDIRVCFTSQFKAIEARTYHRNSQNEPYKILFSNNFLCKPEKLFHNIVFNKEISALNAFSDEPDVMYECIKLYVSYAYRFTSFHELGHIMLGHSDYFCDYKKRIGTLHSFDIRASEIDADDYGIVRLLRYVSENIGLCNSIFSKAIILVLVYISFCTLYASDGIDETSMDQLLYLPLRMRLENIIDVSIHELSNPRYPEVNIKCMRSTLNNSLQMIENFLSEYFKEVLNTKDPYSNDDFKLRDMDADILSEERAYLENEFNPSIHSVLIPKGEQ